MEKELDLSLDNVVQNTHNILAMITSLSGYLQGLFGIMTGSRADGSVRPRIIQWHWANYGFTVHIKLETKASMISVAIEEPIHKTPWLAERLAKAQAFLKDLNIMFGGGKQSTKC